MLLAEIDYNKTTHDEGIELIKQLKLTSIIKIIEELVSLYKYLYSITPYDINNGMCEDFAEDIVEILSKAESFWADELIDNFDYDAEPCGIAHKFVRYKGRYYDSECSEGVDTWEKLPLFVKNKELEEVV